jgi:RNA polymerase sigma-70 factor (ECF subfamily)
MGDDPDVQERNDDAELVALMRRYLAGELRAFDELYARTSWRVLGLLLGMTRDRARAEDLCQSTYLKFHRARGGWIDGSPLMPWLIAIARNTFLDDARRRKRKRESLSKSGEVPDVVDLREPAAVGLGEAIDEAVAGLSPLQRDAFVLTRQSGLSVREAAQVLGTSEAAVKVRVHRAVLALRDALRSHRQEVP